MLSQIIPILIVIFIVFVFFVFPALKKKKDMESMEIYSKKVNEITKEIVTSTSDSLPNAVIEKVLGIVKGVSKVQASTKSEFELAEKSAFYEMLKNAKEKGANGVISIKMSSGTYEQQGSKWQVSQIIYTGTAVITKK